MVVDYAALENRVLGETVIAGELLNSPNEKIRAIAKDNLENIHNSKCDFRF